MGDFGQFVQLGFRHIVDWSALDHILFLVVLAAVYRPRDWKRALVVVSAFTVGHTTTLALAVTDVIPVSVPLVEFLIPVTIVATAVENVTGREAGGRWYRPVFAGVFGLVHGAGFAAYLKALFMDRIAVPLVSFNVGIELGQIVILVVVGALFLLVDRMLAAVRPTTMRWTTVRLRTVLISAIIGVVAAGWAVERRPW